MTNLKQNEVPDDIHSDIVSDIENGIVAAIPVPDDIHSNIGKTYDFIQANLPKAYAREVNAILPDNAKTSLAYIRKVKKYRMNNARIMIALYRVAQWNKLQETN